MKLYARQGDLVIEKLAKPIEGELIPAKDIVFAGDSSGHRHVLRGKAQHRVDGDRTLVRVAKTATLTHEKSDGHKDVMLVPGDYEVRPLRERGDGSDRAVED
jgi:hypothetical protein